MTPSASGKPAATAAKQRTITAAVTAIDMNVPSITLKGPKYWTYSSKVADKDALAKLQVGDSVDITWTEALLRVGRAAHEVGAGGTASHAANWRSP